MDSKKDFWVLVIAFSVVVVLSNILTANYIEDRLSNKLRLEMQELSYGIRQIQMRNPATATTVSDEKWNHIMAPTELSKYLDIKLDQVYKIIDDKKSGIPYLSIDGAYRFSKDGIDEWLKSRAKIITAD